MMLDLERAVARLAGKTGAAKVPTVSALYECAVVEWAHGTHLFTISNGYECGLHRKAAR